MAIAVLNLIATSAVLAREVVDMAGHRVTIPDGISRVYASMPPPAC